METKEKFQILAIILAVCLAISLFFNVYPSPNTSNTNAKTFVYEWPYGNLIGVGHQTIVNGTLRLEITFEWGEDALSINAKINDDAYSEGGGMGLVFDRNGNGFIDIDFVDQPYLLGTDNTTMPRDIALCKDGKIKCLAFWSPERSPYHNCTFNEAEGYTFNIRIPKGELSTVKANMVYFYYIDFGCPSLWDVELYWVSVMFEGWQ
ncbi:MAG: hypothetical protein OEY95_06800 [Candidatus Bathyarchaeota archaeon]|nr:hypothetical protein [Candidatus Bathyarchaeota archaeon]